MRRIPSILLCLLCLSACGGGGDAAAPDNALAGNGATTANDPVLRTVLRDQIMVDPTLVGRANADAIRPPVAPYSAAVPPDGIADTGKPPERDRLQPAPPAKPSCPECTAAKRALTLGALAEAEGAPFDRCAGAVGYSAAWADRLPAAVPLYPQANVHEAAGADGPACALRIVRFRTTAAPQRLLDWYYTRARAAGFAAEHHTDGSTQALAGKDSGGAFLLLVRAAPGGGSRADLLVNRGR